MEKTFSTDRRKSPRSFPVISVERTVFLFLFLFAREFDIAAYINWILFRRFAIYCSLSHISHKAIRVINDVPLMESITPHYSSLDFLKFPDIVKLNTCMLFYDYFHHDKFPNLPVSLVSELHNYSTRSASDRLERN